MESFPLLYRFSHYEWLVNPVLGICDICIPDPGALGDGGSSRDKEFACRRCFGLDRLRDTLPHLHGHTIVAADATVAVVSWPAKSTVELPAQEPLEA